MSYLSYPRLHFAGQFQGDVSTVNNDPTHFDSSGFDPSNHLYGDQTNGWWNPNGSGAWRFLNCTVQRVVYRDGSICENAGDDPIIGASVNGADAQVEGKVVDLDSENQGVAEIWGFRVVVRARGCGFDGSSKVSPFTDFWLRFPQGYRDNMWGAYYQSLLRDVVWDEFKNSPPDPFATRKNPRFRSIACGLLRNRKMIKMRTVRYSAGLD